MSLLTRINDNFRDKTIKNYNPVYFLTHGPAQFIQPLDKEGLKTLAMLPIPPSRQINWADHLGTRRACFWSFKMTFNRPLALTLLTLLALTGCETTMLNGHAASSGSALPASMITPMVEKRETLVATGYAVVSVQNHKNPAQQRLLAIRASKLDAYRSLTEQVYGQQLDATTTVADMTVMSDTFRAKVEGVIYGAVLVSIAPVGDDTYETTLSLDQHVVRDLRSLYLNQLAARRR